LRPSALAAGADEARRKALLHSTSGVKGDADDDEHDAEHSNGSNKFHGYNSLIFEMRRSILTSTQQDEPHDSQEHRVRRCSVGRGEKPTGKADIGDHNNAKSKLEISDLFP
jgi:hypothetical protein